MTANILLADRLSAHNPKFQWKSAHTFLRILPVGVLFVLLGVALASAQVRMITLQSPQLAAASTTNLLSPIHIQATAEDMSPVTGYVVYVDNQNVYRDFSSTVDAWVTVPAGPHILYVKAWDAQTHVGTATYQINVAGFAPPVPPVSAQRVSSINGETWTADNDPNVGGKCNTGTLGSFPSASDPNTENAAGLGQHFVLNSACAYDDSLFYWKSDAAAQQFTGATNYLWEFWFYVPTSTPWNGVQALEFDLFHALPLSDGVHEFMFGSQCNYVSNQWQFWLPQGTRLTWVNSGITPCRFTTGQWHHAVYFLQRVTPGGYQEIPQTFSSASDSNSSLRFGTLTIDGQTSYLGGLSWSTIPKPSWGQVFGVQHQLDSSIPGVLIEEYSNRESVTAW